MPQQQQQKQQQQVQLERPTVGIGSGKPWGAPTEGSMSIAERLRQPQQLHHQQPQQVKPQEQVEGPGPNTAAPTTPPADNQQSLSNGVELPHDQVTALLLDVSSHDAGWLRLEGSADWYLVCFLLSCCLCQWRARVLLQRL